MTRLALLALLLAACAPAGGPDEEAACAARPGTRCVVAGQYAAGPLHAALLGRGYRELWTAPVEVPVLDLDSEGGLRAVEVLGHVQSRSLALAAADGRAFTFRCADKDASQLVTGPLRHLPGIVPSYRDQTAAGLPAAPVVAAPLARAAGVLQSEPRLGVMPDDPRLGSIGAEFAGRLGTLEEYPTPAAGGRPGTFGALEIVDTDELWERLASGPRERVAARAYLRARLVDLVLGDVDRHPGQWRWARLEPGGPWHPIAEDRDLAFVRFGGLMVRVSKPWFPLLASFDGDFQVGSLAHQARGTDTRLLAPLDRAAWKQEVAAVQARVTPRVVDDALARMPARWRELEGDRLGAALRRRVSSLSVGAEGLYARLAEQVEVWGTRAEEEVRARSLADGRLELSVTAAGAAAPHFQRVLDPAETEAVRLCGFGANDRLLLEAAAEHRIEVQPARRCEPPPTTIAPGAEDETAQQHAG
jgi:hypothetical protein